MKFLLIVIFVICCNISFAQSLIKIKNPSFDGEPFQGLYTDDKIEGWLDFGIVFFPKETRYDLHSSESSFWNLNAKAYHGDTFLGLVARDNGTHEIIGQKLEQSIIKGSTYEMSIYASVNTDYLSHSNTTFKEANYVSPVKLQLYGINYNEETEEMTYELLAETSGIVNQDWKKFKFLFSPVFSNYNHIVFTPNFIDENLFTNGHVLLDLCSDIVALKQ